MKSASFSRCLLCSAEWFYVHMVNVKAVKLAQLVRRSLMVREVASSISSGAAFAHMNIELACTRKLRLIVSL